jgi:hypothetical protein
VTVLFQDIGDRWGLFYGVSRGLAVSDCFGPGLWAGVGRDVGALVLEELDCLGVPERVDALPGVESADHAGPRWAGVCRQGCVDFVQADVT